MYAPDVDWSKLLSSQPQAMFIRTILLSESGVVEFDVPNVKHKAARATLNSMVGIEVISNRFSTVCIKAKHRTHEHVIDTRDPLDFCGSQSWRDATEALKLH